MTEETPYTQVNSFAVGSVALGIMSGFALVFPALWTVGVVGMVLGILAIGQTWKYGHHGRGMARCGACLPCLFAVLAIAIGYFQEREHLKKFQSESLPGYRRVDFGAAVRLNAVEMNSGNGVDFEVAVRLKNGEPNLLKDGLAPYVGQRICLKGYSGPSDSGRLSGSFVLTVNGREGDGSVLVNLNSTMYYTVDPLAVSGTLTEIPPRDRPSPRIKYQLLEPEIRYSISPYQLALYESPYRSC